MKPLSCCTNCMWFNQENNQFRNMLRCIFSCDEYVEEECRILYNEQKADKGCSTCKNCKHVRDYPGFVTGEECDCEAGLACDTVLFSLKNCPKWIGRYEGVSKG